MVETSAGASAGEAQLRTGSGWRRWFGLPLRDLLILPAIFLVTPLIILALAEAACYRPFYQKLGDACLAPDPAVGYAAKPNCTSTYKVADSAWVENRYNDCGYRTAESCAPPPPDTIRAAVIGSSISTGYMVPYQAMFSTQAARDLTQDCGRPVQFQDLGGIGYQGEHLFARMRQALELNPQVLVMTITPYDLMKGAAVLPGQAEAEAPPNGLLQRIKFAVRDRIKKTAVWQALMYVGALEPRFFLGAYLHNRDNSGYLRAPLPPAWQDRIARLDALLDRMADTAKHAGVPFVLIYVPPRPQVMLLERPGEEADLRPTQLERRIGRAAARDGIQYIDVTREFRSVGAPNRVFYVLSDHPTPLGHKLMAESLEHRLLADHIGPFAACTQLADAKHR